MTEHPAKIASRKWRTDNPERYKQLQDEWNRTYGRAATLKSKFKMTVLDYDTMFEAQGLACAICGTTDATKWCVDHDHACCPVGRSGTRRTCGKCVRGILCDPCNVGIAKLKDNPEIMASAIKYLSRGGDK